MDWEQGGYGILDSYILITTTKTNKIYKIPLKINHGDVIFIFLTTKKYIHPVATRVITLLAITVRFIVQGVRNIPIAGRRLP